MGTFVLVQGAWIGSWYWKRVRSRLQAAGHDVFTLTLTGLADRSHLLTRDVNLDTHILDVVNLIRWEELSDPCSIKPEELTKILLQIYEARPAQSRSAVND